MNHRRNITIIIILAMMIPFATDYFSDAAALKSKGTPSSVIGSDKVCGDRLCSETPEEAEEKALASYLESFDESNPDIPKDAELLFIQTGESGEFIKTDNGYLLTIFNVSPQVIYFSDNPYHLAGHMTTLDWTFGIWKDKYLDFEGNPPNAVLSVFADLDVSNEIVLELHNAKYIADQNTMQYDVIVIKDFFEELKGQERQHDTSIPEKFGDVSLFIDNNKESNPCNGTSYIK